MREVLPGVFHWTTFHEGIGQPVHSYFVSALDPAVLIDPRLPPEGLEWFVEHEVPRHVLLTNRHHYRHSRDFAAAFGATVWCHEKGLHEFTHGETVRAFKHGDTLPGGVLALPVGTLCDEETAFYLPIQEGILAVGDAIIRPDGELAFVPDELMGEHPRAVKQGLKKVFRQHLAERSFAHLLMAHGEPVIYEARTALSRFVGAG